MEIDLDLDIYDIEGLSKRLDVLINYKKGSSYRDEATTSPGPLLVQIENRLRHEIESLRFELLGSTPAGEGECFICRRPAIPGKVQFCQLHFPRIKTMPCHVCKQPSVGIKETSHSYCSSCGVRSSGQKVVDRIVNFWANFYSKPFGGVDDR